MQATRVVLGVEDPALQEEVLHFLDRLPGVEVIGAAGDGHGLARQLRQAGPDAAVVTPGVLRQAHDLDGAGLLVVAERETTEGLRAAIRAGARGFYLWPEERTLLGRDAERAARPRTADTGRPGRVAAVYGARGGAGVTFLATHLAARCSGVGRATVLADMDPVHADVTAALGIAPEGQVPTMADLRPVLDELSPEHLDRVLHRHAAGFHVLLGPAEPAEPLADRHVGALVRALRARFDVVLLHLPRTFDAAVRAALQAADDVLVVVTLDVMAFRDARRVLASLDALGLDGRCRLVINRATKADVAPQDAERVFGLRPLAVIGRDRGVARAQDRGELVRSGAAARKVAALAGWLAEEAP